MQILPIPGKELDLAFEEREYSLPSTSQACLRAGMVHHGRSGRQIHGPNKSAANGGSSNHSNRQENGAVRSPKQQQQPKIVPPLPPQQQQQSRLHHLAEESAQQDVQLLQSRVRELEARVREKDAQLEIQRRQISTLKSRCVAYEETLNNGDGSNGFDNGHLVDASYADDKQEEEAPFGNGGVTITRTTKANNR